MGVLSQLNNSQQKQLEELLGTSVVENAERNQLRKFKIHGRWVMIALVLILVSILSWNIVYKLITKFSLSGKGTISTKSEEVEIKGDTSKDNNSGFNALIGNVSSQNLRRQQTGQVINNSLYTKLSGESSNAGLGISGRIMSGIASQTGDGSELFKKSLIKNQESKLLVTALDKNDNKLTETATFNAKGEILGDSLGNWETWLWLPSGTNSIAVINRSSGNQLDRIYAVNQSYAIDIHTIPTSIDSNSQIPVFGDVENYDNDGVVILAFNNIDTHLSKTLSAVVPDNGKFHFQFKGDDAGITRTSRGNITASFVTPFSIDTITSNAITVIKK